MRGSCDICDRQDVEVSRSWYSGIETYCCEDCSERAEAEYLGKPYRKRKEYEHEEKLEKDMNRFDGGKP